jgi:hypothetical protein
MIAEFIHARDYAKARAAWVVVVVPSDLYDEALNSMAAIASGHPFGGRTLVVGQGKVSVSQALDAVFVTEPFKVMFAGWGQTKTDQAKEMARWRRAAVGTVSRTA